MTKLGDEFSQRGWEIGRRTTQEGIDKNREKGMELIPASPAMAAATEGRGRQGRDPELAQARRPRRQGRLQPVPRAVQRHHAAVTVAGIPR